MNLISNMWGASKNTAIQMINHIFTHLNPKSPSISPCVLVNYSLKWFAKTRFIGFVWMFGTDALLKLAFWDNHKKIDN